MERERFDDLIGEAKNWWRRNVTFRPESRRGLRIFAGACMTDRLSTPWGLKSSNCYAKYDRPAWCAGSVAQVLRVLLCGGQFSLVSVRVLLKPWHRRLDHENVIAGSLSKYAGLNSRWKSREADDIAQCILLVQNPFHNKPRECFDLYYG
ncbi:hypothetical protein GGI43DRAFT_396651 [Trichoderma evansii]